VSTDAWGLTSGYHDNQGHWHQTSPQTRAALLTAMGVNPERSAAPGPARVRVLQAGQAAAWPEPADLTLEDGTGLRVESALPSDLPIGYHELRALRGGEVTRLIVSPGRCALPEDLRAWGWAVQLYATRSQASWGLGDLGDLRELAGWSARDLDAAFLLVNPLFAVAPTLPQQSSPYSPGSRRYLNPLYLRIEALPGAADARLDLGTLATAGRGLNARRQLDRDAVFRLKLEALERLWARFPGDPAFDRYRAVEGAPLGEFATYCALAERYGPSWRLWPEEYRHPAGPAVARFTAEDARRVRFHQWLQWQLDVQLAGAAREIRLMTDLPVGFHPDGADAWAWQDVLAQGVSVGAPPDAFNVLGQDWGLPPFVPHALRAAGYEPFIQTIRGALRHAGGLRIDHIMGLFRLFWIPWGGKPAEGAYVRYPAEELLAIVAVESHRAQAIIAGEDLGTVEEGVRAKLAAQRILSYRVLWFERDGPARYPRQALAAVTTHDLPTITGLWTGADLAELRAVGVRTNAEGTRHMRDRLAAMAGLAEGAEAPEVIVRTHQLLAEAPSVLVTATLEDALAVTERPNIPGTTTERPNWSLGLPVPLETIQAHPLPRAVAAALARQRSAH
jgi:4-alpha-glucanotransferase